MNIRSSWIAPAAFVSAWAFSCVTVSALVKEVLSAGSDHSVLLRSDGTVWSWGSNTSGQLGHNVGGPSSVPVQVVTSSGPLTGIVKVDAGNFHVLALRDDGTVWAWGNNYLLQLGNGTNLSVWYAIQVKNAAGTGFLTNVADIDAGGNHSMALLNDGSVYVWGNNAYCQLGDGTTTSSNLPKTVSLGQAATKISAGGGRSFATLADGTVKAWGEGSLGGLGLGTGVTATQPYPVTIPGMTGVAEISAGTHHSLALMNDGTMKSCGWHSLGNGSYGSSASWVNVSNLTGVTAISAGHEHSLAIRGSDKTAWAWGQNNFPGQFGTGNQTSSTVPVQVTAIGNVAEIAASGNFSMFMTEDGAIWGTGNNQYGQLGDGVSPDRFVAEQVPALGRSKAISSRGDHALALDEATSEVWAWGDNYNGKLGNNSTTRSSFPVKVSGLADAVEVSAGDSFSLARRTNGTIVAWGDNSEGQLGDLSYTNRLTPVAVNGLSGVQRISAGYSHGLALLSNGSVKAWGYGWEGQLGDGASVSSNNPVSVALLTSGVDDVSAGDSFSLALKDGEVWSWGANWAGELGIGSTTSQLTPVKIPTFSGVTAISAGATYTLAIKNGEVWAWGLNDSGQLGDGTVANKTAPVRAGTLTDVIAVKAGQMHSMALKSDGTVWSWGYNGAGQVGDNTTSIRYTPVQVARLEGVSAISSGTGVGFALKDDKRLSAWGRSTAGLVPDGVIPWLGTPSMVPGINRFHPTPTLVMTPADATIAPLGSKTKITGTFTSGGSPMDRAYFYSRGVEMNVDQTAPFEWAFEPLSWGDIEINQIAVNKLDVTSKVKSIKLRVPYDHDADGMPDWWEMYHFGDTGALPSGDADGDGLSNAAEFAAGLSPSDPDFDGDGIPDGVDADTKVPEANPHTTSSLVVWTRLQP